MLVKFTIEVVCRCPHYRGAIDTTGVNREIHRVTEIKLEESLESMKSENESIKSFKIIESEDVTQLS